MKKKYSIFIGRYQPLHKGHIKLITSVLSEGKNVCIAIRDTEKDEKNPYSLLERQDMILKAFKKAWEADKLITIVIPDIEEICYGRKVGWGIREIRLDKDIESISSTKIRNSQK